MADSPELGLWVADPQQSADVEPYHLTEVHMTGVDSQLDMDEASIPRSAAETALYEDDSINLSEFEQSTSGDLQMPNSNRSLDFDDDSPIKSESEAGHPRLTAAEISEADATPPTVVSLVERADDTATANLKSRNSALPVESARETVEAQSSVSKDAARNEDVPSINLGQSVLSTPKAVPELGQLSLEIRSKRDKAIAKQAQLAKRLGKTNTANASSGPSSTSFSHHGGETVNRAGSDIFIPPDLSGVHPEQAKFESLKAAYQRKKNAGTNGLDSDVAFLQAEAKETARLRKVQTDGMYEDSESDGLFVTSDVMTPASHDPASDAGIPRQAFFASNAKSRKRKPEDVGNMAPPSKKRTKKSKAPTGRSLGASKNKKDVSGEVERTLEAMASGSRPRVSKTAKESSRKPAHSISNINSLLTGTDVFKDTEAVAGRANQPAFKAGTSRKEMALRDLLASVPQDERSAAMSDSKFLDQSLKDFDGQGSCRAAPDGSGWKLSGMNCTLKHYQVLGAAFMRKRENQEHHPRGGILADEMGLGKTIQMIANIVNGKPKPGQPRTTLIVASPALISQWHTEIFKFTQTRKENRRHGIDRIIQHRAGYRQGGDSGAVRKAILESDICLTTYTEVTKSYPKAIFPAELTTDRSKAEWWKEHFRENKGVFHDMKFLRVVLDEAQAIKNHLTHSSMACRALRSEYYWAITGTPLVNGITEMYPYLKLLRHPHTGSMRTFQANFCSPNDPTGSEKLGVFLQQILIRRTHKDLMFGARLLDLPTPKQNVIYLEFNSVERTVYEIVKRRFIQRINTITRREGISTQYTHIWTMLLRLRQICSHVLLIQDTILDLLEREDFEKLDEITRETDGHSKEHKEVLEHLSHMLAAHIAAGKFAENDVDVVPGGFNTTERRVPNLGKKHGKIYDFHKYLSSAAQAGAMDEVNLRMKCCSCRKMPVDPQITSCHHIYCRACMMSLQHAAARTARSAARCSECGVHFSTVKDVRDPTDPAHETETDASSYNSSPASGKKKKQKKVEELDWIGQPGQILPSAKTVAVKAQILTWLAEAPDCKIIIYTQFLPMIRIMGKVCQGEGWGFLKYAGNMSHAARESALKDFAEKDDKRVMLMSLKCGGLGLNIVAASRVILMDPWWNDAVEQQAFCRVFRIGQTNETRLTRLCIKNSIDSAMFAVKERKTAEIDKVMDSPAKGPRSTSDLLRLFGPVGDDEDGRPDFIFPEPDEDGDANEVERFYELQDSRSFPLTGRQQQQHAFRGNDI